MCGLRVDYGKRQRVFVKLEFPWINQIIFVLNNQWTRSMACGPCPAMVHGGPPWTAAPSSPELGLRLLRCPREPAKGQEKGSGTRGTRWSTHQSLGGSEAAGRWWGGRRWSELSAERAQTRRVGNGGGDECSEEGQTRRPFIGSEGEEGGQTEKAIGLPVVAASMPAVRFSGVGKLRGEWGVKRLENVPPFPGEEGSSGRWQRAWEVAATTPGRAFGGRRRPGG
jgi:hypothetical protein